MSHEFEDRALEDEEFEEYLRGGTEVSQRYQELGGREVPPALDAKVLRQAQQQAAKSVSRRRPWLRWGTPLALAATALIAITVIMQPEVEAPRAPPPMAESQMAESQMAESQVAESRASDAPVAELPNIAGDSPADPAPQAEPRAVLPERGRSAVEKDSASSDALARRAAKPMPAPATQPAVSGSANARANSSVAQDRDLRDEQREAAATPERNAQRLLGHSGAPGEPARPSEELEAVPQSGELQEKRLARESGSQARSDELAAATPEESKAKRKQETREAKSDAAPPAAAAPAPVAAVAPPPPQAPVTSAPAAAAAGPPPPEPAAEGVATLEADRATAPATWVRWIRDLRAQGQQVRAEELLKRLRAAHPSFALPADLASPPQR